MLFGTDSIRETGVVSYSIQLSALEPQSSLGVEPLRLKLLRKLANTINGVDLTNVNEGAVLVVTPRQAAILVAAGWAEETRHAPGTLLNLKPRKET